MYSFTLLWLVAFVALVVLEAATVSLVSIWFALGALAALLVSLFCASIAVQLVVFVLVSALAIAAMKPLVKKLHAKHTPTNGDRSIGRTATVLAPIAPGAPGRVRLDGVDWAAESDVCLAPGEGCRVTAIRSTVLSVEPQADSCTTVQ